MSNLNIRTYRCGSSRESGEGLRLGVVRYLPRGIQKEDYAKQDFFDIWLPILAPSQELLRWFTNRQGDPVKLFEQFRLRYEKEMKQTDARQVIKLIAELSKNQPISIGCYCEDENLCHRSILCRLIE